MKRKLQYNKNQYTLTIPKHLVESIGLSKGSEFEVKLGNKKIILEF